MKAIILAANDKLTAHCISWLKERIKQKKAKKISTYIIGLQGPPGIGKTTASKFMVTFLRSLGYRAETFSIDDFYMSNNERIKLTEKYKNNPFYSISRGMPGTHRLNLLYKTLYKAKKGRPFQIPQFDKSLHSKRGDVSKNKISINKKLDFIIFEGWCVNMPHIKNEEFVSIIKKNKYVNDLFKEIDANQAHFKTVLRLAKNYQKIWALIDGTLFLAAKNMKHLIIWKNEQEKELLPDQKDINSKKDAHRFIKHFIPFSYFLSEKAKKAKNKHILTMGLNHLPLKNKV